MPGCQKEATVRVGRRVHGANYAADLPERLDSSTAEFSNGAISRVIISVLKILVT